MLTSINLHPCENAPCIFRGTILPNKPPLYVGVYVDDFVYFSTDTEMERAFETKLSSLTDVDFLGVMLAIFLALNLVGYNPSITSLPICLKQLSSIISLKILD